VFAAGAVAEARHVVTGEPDHDTADAPPVSPVWDPVLTAAKALGGTLG
jgi:hypothetical protein